MPKTPSIRVYSLIKSMTAAEKRYFKVFIGSSEGDNKYRRLFDAIDLQPVFDDEALAQAVYPGESIESRKYSELKGYLYQLILKSLQSYDEHTSIDYQLKRQLQSIRVLFKRARYEDCRSIILKTKKLAYQYEDFTSVVELLNWEKQVAYAEMDVAFFDNQLVRIDEEEKTCLRLLSNLSDYRNIFFKLYISIRTQNFLRNEDKIAYLKGMIQQPLLQEAGQAQSHLAQVLYYRIYTLYYYSLLDIGQFYYSGRQLLEVMESKPLLLQEDTSSYISALSNFTLSCGLLDKYAEVNACLQKFKGIKPKTLDDEIKIHRSYYTYLFGLCIYTGDFEAGVLALQQHFEESQKLDSQLFETSSFYFQYFYIYFGAKDYDKALLYLNRWLGLPKSIDRQDMQSLAKIINLMLHYELGNYMLLEYLLRSTYRYLQQRERLLEFERRILVFIRASQKFKTTKELKQGFSQLREGLIELSSIPSEEAMLRYFDIIAWLESKITDRDFATVVQQNYQTKLTINH